ncbi:MAG TPA: potassium channel family protein [Gaiellales bacterium]|nr:potassium channel family protein [Gaiellales bacterium]
MRASQQRYGALLLAIAVTFFFLGVAQPGDLQRTLGTLLVGGTLMLALVAAETPAPRLRLAGAVIAVIVAAVIIASLTSHSETAQGVAALATALLVAVAPPALVLGLMRHLRRARMITIPIVAGVLCLYLLLGLFFAFAFIAIQNLGGGPFFSNGDRVNSNTSIYFSFVTMTTVGYGDLTARTSLGHTIAVTEALLGQIYLVTVVAAIVSRLVPSGAPQPGGDQPHTAERPSA